MNKFIALTISLLALFTVVPLAAAQDATDSAAEDAARAERRARIEELRHLTREQREAQRQDIEGRLEGLTEDQHQALRERRRLQQQARARQDQRVGQGARPHRQRPQRRPQQEKPAKEDQEKPDS